MNVSQKANLTKYEVHLKIDNLNVEDMFDRNRTEELLDIFRFVDKPAISRFFLNIVCYFFFQFQEEAMEERAGSVRNFSRLGDRAGRPSALETERGRRVSFLHRKGTWTRARAIIRHEIQPLLYIADALIVR